MGTCLKCGRSNGKAVGDNSYCWECYSGRTDAYKKGPRIVGKPIELGPQTVKGIGRILKMLLILFIIAALIGGGLLIFKNAIFGNSGLYERAMNKKLDKYEQSDKLIEDYVLFESGADYTFETLKRNIDSNDYHLKYYTTGGVADVIKYTLSDEVFIGWTFNGGFDELSNRTFVLRDGIIYEDGEQKIAYNTDS